MAQYPKIRIQIINNPNEGDWLDMFINPFNPLRIFTTATTSPTPGLGRYTIGATPAATMANFYALLVREHSYPFTFFLAPDNSYVEITCNRYDLGDWQYSIYVNIISDFEVTVFPMEAVSEFDISGILYATAGGNLCDNVKITTLISDGVPPYIIRAIYNGGVQQTKNTSNEADFFFDFPRSTAGSRRIEVVSDGVTKSIEIPVVGKLTGVSPIIAYGQFNATVTITPIRTAGVPLTPYQYSIDDIVYQASNVFEIGVSGDYTAYVIDKYGCKKYVLFTVDLEDRKPDPFFKIEITNPLRAVDQNYTGIKNITNQLSADCDISNVESRFYRQPFRIGDIVRTQFKSNYEAHAVKIYDCDDVLIDTLTPTIKIENTNQLDKRDALIKTGDPGKTNIAFTQGDIYDPTTNNVIDSYFQSGGRLPSFARAGMIITLDDALLTGTFEVEEVVYDSDLQAWACVIDANYSGVAKSVIVLSIYNLEEYNIYEVEIALPAGQYYAVFEATDSSTLYPDQEWKTEPFWIADSEVVVIDYSSEINEALIDYRTNIEFRLCIPGRFAKYQPDVQGEEFRDDLGNICLQKSTYNRVWTIETDLMPWWLAEKVMIASRHRILKVNGIEVVNTEAPEITDRLGERNPFYQITGVYQENIDISISDETGIISGARGILSGNENQVIGI